MDVDSARRGYGVLAGVGILVAVAAAVTVELNVLPGLGLHEAGGAVLLALLLLSLGIAGRRDVRTLGLLPPALLALVLLVGMGATGALLAFGTLPASLDSLPPVILAGLVLALSEMVRRSVARGPDRPRAPSAVPPSAGN